jgi:CTP:phosphocholine cytidylyltransferase-like protein
MTHPRGKKFKNNTLKIQLISILEALSPKCQDKKWLDQQILFLKQQDLNDLASVLNFLSTTLIYLQQTDPNILQQNNNDLNDSPVIISFLGTAIARYLQKADPKLLRSTDCELFKNFINHCNQQIPIAKYTSETLDEIIERILNETTPFPANQAPRSKL